MQYNLQLHLDKGGFSNEGVWHLISQIMQELYVLFETTVEDKSDVEGIYYIGILV